MVHENNFIVVIKKDGKILREKNGKVYLPFGSDYTIFMKNLDSRKAVVSIDIDGKPVTEHKLIVEGNNTLELKGFEEGGKVRNNFRFIEKTEAVKKHRGEYIDDGYIRVEVNFEKRVEEKIVEEKCIPWIDTSKIPYNPYWVSSVYSLTDMPVSYNTQSNFIECSCVSMKSTDEGITVKGSKTTQDFVTGVTKELEFQSTVFVIRLSGCRDKKIVTKAITTKDKIKCSSCGTKSKATVNFCPVCGTNLQ